MITEYAVSEASDLDGLVKEVTQMIIEGWQPHGGCHCVFAPNQTQVWHQTMVKTAAVTQ